MTDELRMLDELEALEKKATPAPWKDAGNKIGHQRGHALCGIAEIDFDEEADKDISIAARNALPLLLRLARRGLEAGEVVDGTVLHGGVVRKVIGEFKLTDDGAIACEEATCWGVYRRGDPDDPEDVWKVGECRRTGRYDDYGCWWQFDDCEEETVDVLAVYSSKELAEAAVVSENAKPKEPKPEVFDSIREEIQAKAARAALSRLAAKEER